MSDEELNMLRCHANDIIVRLYEHGKRAQLELLAVAVKAAIERLDEKKPA